MPDASDLLDLAREFVAAYRLNAAEDLVFHHMERCGASAEALALLGDVYFAKCDMDRALSAYQHAVKRDPQDLSCQAKLKHTLVTQAKLKHAYVPEGAIDIGGGPVGRADAGSDALQKYDFLVVPPARGGSRAISSLLCLHPEIYITSRDASDDALNQQNEWELLQREQTWLRPWKPRAFGMVLHEHVLAEKERVPTRLAGIFENGRVIMSVRDPLMACRALYNHRLAAEMGNYSFRGAGLSWLPAVMPIDLMLALDPAMSYPDTPIDFDPRSDEFLDLVTDDDLKYHQLAGTFAPVGPVFSTELPILFRPGSGELERLLGILGVEKTNWMPPNLPPLGSRVQVCMERNTFKIEIGGVEIECMLTFAGLAAGVGHFSESTEIAKFSPPADVVAEFGLGANEVALAALTREWIKLPRHYRMHLKASGLFDELLQRVLFPIWSDRYRRYAAMLAPHSWGDPEDIPVGILPRMKARVADDMVQYLKEHPHHEPHWSFGIKTLLNG